MYQVTRLPVIGTKVVLVRVRELYIFNGYAISHNVSRPPAATFDEDEEEEDEDDAQELRGGMRQEMSISFSWENPLLIFESILEKKMMRRIANQSTRSGVRGVSYKSHTETRVF